MAEKTFFDTLPKSFEDVPVDAEHDNAIATGPFLEAAESLSPLFGTYIQCNSPIDFQSNAQLIPSLSFKMLHS